MGFSTEQAYYEYYNSDITVAGTYTYRLVQQDYDGTLTNAADKEFLFERPTQVRWYQNDPNPFNPSTTIRYNVPQKKSTDPYL